MKKYGLLGEHLTHSYSPLIHSLMGDYQYSLTELSPGDAEAFLLSRDFEAYNVTIPYKKLALSCCDEVSPEAQAIGAVNTLRVEGGRLIGYNTDVFGFEYTLARLGVSVSGKDCIVLGDGGASATVQYVLRKQGARSVLVFSRSSALPMSELVKHTNAQIIVNTTPVGMFPNNGVSPIDLSLFENCLAVIDLIYNPARTALLLEAERLGIPCANGLMMLVAQAKRANEIFFARTQSDAIIEEAVKRINADTLNVTLIGMPGCGKSTVGHILAQKLGRELIDTDELITRKHGRTPAEIIRQDGEQFFRSIESEALSDVTKLSSKVIATGGGCVTLPSNHSLLRQNSTVVFLERDIDLLAKDDRPLSLDLPALYQKRLPLYLSCCDHKVKGDTPESAAAQILALI